MLTRRLLLSAFAAAIAFPAYAEDLPETFHVHDAYARSMGGIGASGAVFMMLHNDGAADDRLIGVKTDVAQKAELHTHTMTDDGVMQMLQIEGGVPMPAGNTHALMRGGDHVMLMGLTRAVKDGDSFALTLAFESGAELTFDVTVDNTRKPGEASTMDEGDHSRMIGQSDG